MADCSELAKTITELALAIGTQPGKGNIDAIVAEMQTRLPEITREMVVDSIVEATAGQSRTIDEAKKQAAAIKREARRDKKLRDAIAKLEAELQSAERVETTVSATIKTPPPAIQELQKKRDRLKAFVDAARSPKELRALAQSLAREFVANGIFERGALLDAVHSELVKAYPQITRRQTMDAISGYGDFKPLKKGEIEETLRDLKGQLQQIAKLEDMAAGQAPKKTGVERRTPSDEERALIKQVEQAKREGGFVVTDPEKQLKSTLDSIKTRLRNQIADLTKQIQAREKIVTDKRLPPTDAEVESLRKQRDVLKEQFREVFGVPGRTQEQRVEAAKRAIERSIADLTKRLEKSDFSPRKAEAITTPELTALRAKRDDLAKQYKLADPDPPALRAARVRLEQLEKRLREGLGEPDAKPRPAGDPRTAAIRSQIAAVRAALRNSEPAMKKRLEKSIADLESKLNSIIDGSYIAPAKPTPAQTATIERLAFERDRLRKRINQHINSLKPRSRWRYLAEPNNITRLIMLGIDMSALLNQGKFTLVSHPIMTAKRVPELFKGFKADTEARWLKQVENEPEFILANRAGLDLATEGGRLSAQEEQIQSHLLERLPVLRNFAASYRHFMNVLRYDAFKAVVHGLAPNSEVTLDEARVLANYVNVATGRGAVHQKLRGALEGSSQAFLAPRFQISRFQFMLGQPLWTGIFQRGGLKHVWTTRQARKWVAKEYARTLIGLTAWYSLIWLKAALMSDDDEDKPRIGTDPNSSDFLKIIVGNRRIDPLAGVQQWAVLAGRMATGKSTTLDGREVEWSAHHREQFIRGRLAPATGAAFDLLRRRNWKGEKPTFFGALWEATAPLAPREIYEEWRAEAEKDEAVAWALLIWFGERVSTYESQDDEPRSARPRPPRPSRPSRPN